VGEYINIFPTINEIAKMYNMAHTIGFDEWDKKLIYAPLEII
jgi:hypothetical protein